MYESFFQLNARPFLASPVADRYYPAASIEYARETVARCIDRAEGPAVILGAAGTGKSTLCQVLSEQFREHYHVAVLASARLCTRRALLQNILFELKLPYRDREEGELRLSLIDHLEPSDNCPNGMLLLVDEAHMLPLRLLEEIRMITNLVRDGQPRVRLVLAAGLVLDERLASPRLESFNQRIAARCYLQSMSRDETCDYVRAQIGNVGGAPEQIFTDDALHAVYRATDGIPRLVNQVCDHVLMMAAIGQQAPIDAAGVEEAWADLQQLPSPWVATEAAVPASESGVLEFGELDDATCGELGGSDEVVHDVNASLSSGAASDAVSRLDEIESGISEISDEDKTTAEDAETAANQQQFQPAAAAEPEIELVFHHAHDPFNEPFDEEEVIIDPFASLELLSGSDPPATDETGSQTIPFFIDEGVPDSVDEGVPDSVDEGVPDSVDEGESDSEEVDQPRTDVEPVHPPSSEAIVAASLSETSDGESPFPGDDRDLLDIHDDFEQLTDQPAAAMAGRLPRRREYRQLFANLRRR